MAAWRCATSGAWAAPSSTPTSPTWGRTPARSARPSSADRIGVGTAPLKARLLDQAHVAGIGNLLADQVLWQAKLSPRRPAGELSRTELDRLHRNLRRAIKDAIDRGGVHTGRFIAYRDREGHCPRCGAALQRATVGGRTTYWCPREQT